MADNHEHEEHGGIGKYVSVTIALLILTALSFAAPYVIEDTGAMRLFMIAVSCCKAALVILFFMHLIWEADWKYVLTIPASIMSVFLVLMLVPDIGMRMVARPYAAPSRERLLYSSVPGEQQEIEHLEAEHDSEEHEHGDHPEGEDH